MVAQRLVPPVDSPSRFRPLPKQAAFMQSPAQEKLYSGAYGAGKTRVGCELSYFLSIRYAGNRGLIVRKKFSTLRSTTLKTLFERVIPPRAILEHKKNEHLIILDCGTDPYGRDRGTSEIYYMGMDDPLKIGGMDLGWFFYDELIESRGIDEWTMLVGRLRLSRVPIRQAFAATNPGAPGHWAYRYFHLDYAEKMPDRPYLNHQTGRFVVQSSTFDNKWNPTDYMDRVRAFRGIYWRRYGLGQWVGFEGLVYPEFDPTRHIVPRRPVPKHWRKWRSIDYGTGVPFCCQWYAQDPRTLQFMMYREIYMTQRRVEEHARDIIHRSRDDGPFVSTVADHDASENLTMRHHGVNTQLAKKEKKAGMEALRELLRDDPLTGEPGLVFFEDALVELDPALEALVMEPGRGNARPVPTRTTEEFPGYEWKKTPNGTKDEPQEFNNHGMDAARYFAMEVRGPTRKRATSG